MTLVPTPARRVYIFADESGNLDWGSKRGATKFWVLATVTSLNCNFGHILLNHRRELGWDGIGLNQEWHAAESSKEVQKAVFERLVQLDFQAHVTIFDKQCVPETYKRSVPAFYEFAWYWHFAGLSSSTLLDGDEVFVVSASLGVKKQRKACYEGASRAIGQHLPNITHRVAHWHYESDPCLIAADFVAWAVFRKEEWFAPHYYGMIQPKIVSELHFFRDYHPENKKGHS